MTATMAQQIAEQPEVLAGTLEAAVPRRAELLALGGSLAREPGPDPGAPPR